ncbi:NAD-dependent epimerase/dehydratase family protein [Oceanicoccus sp. KOV_DT_Chl]|uniref:NAD-dependent epimerase/dehydratase family protein n=1 Tax=Oceanicoccus sp. KOV_DT_Chl TaxID=1904639 RepID=UPI000C797595|nr:NAD-dependent epimerase/dehydratase family protein [Oceanicoccus sp. KOV_DT_Chl]
MKVLITGASGFVGRHLMPMLKAENHECVAVARSNQGLDAQFLAVGDFYTFNNWSAILEGVSVVIHLAARAHVMDADSADEAELYDRANVDVTVRLAKAALASGVKRFVFISSIKVNGENTLTGASFSSFDVASPKDEYAGSKYRAERYLEDIARNSTMELVIIRPPLVYGPGVKANFLRLLNLARSPIPLPFALVDNRRDMVSVYNLCDLIVTCIEHPAASNQTFLVSDGRSYSLSELLSVMSSVQGGRSRLWPVPLSLLTFGFRLLGKEELVQRLLADLQVDIHHTVETLEWRPKYTLEDTLRKMIQ